MGFLNHKSFRHIVIGTNHVDARVVTLHKLIALSVCHGFTIVSDAHGRTTETVYHPVGKPFIKIHEWGKMGAVRL
jgi:hypothetical protein